MKRHTDFIKAAIFPGGCLPSVASADAAANEPGPVATYERRHRTALRRDAAPLAREPRRALEPSSPSLGFDERFARLWDFYFSYCEAGFDERYVSDVQLLYTGPAWRPAALRGAAKTEPVHEVRELMRA